MYFENFPLLYYTLDDNETGQLIQDIFRRVVLSTEVASNNVAYDSYDIRDGDTPDILADRFYGDPGLYWIILLVNNISDPRFDWPMDYNTLVNHIERKYPSNLYLSANVAFNFNIGEKITQTTSGATAKVLTKLANRLQVINVEGSFANGSNVIGSVSLYEANTRTTACFETTKEQIEYFQYSGNLVKVDNYSFYAKDPKFPGFTFGNITTNSFTTETGNVNTPAVIYRTGGLEAVSKRIAEIRANDEKRNIRILKPEFVSRVLEEFKRSINI